MSGCRYLTPNGWWGPDPCSGRLGISGRPWAGQGTAWPADPWPPNAGPWPPNARPRRLLRTDLACPDMQNKMRNQRRPIGR